MQELRTEIETAGQEYAPMVGSLGMSDQCVHPGAQVSVVVETFFSSPQLDALAVVKGRSPMGLVTRNKLLFTVFRRYGFELYGRKAIWTIADPEPLTVNEDEPLDSVIEKALRRDTQDIYDEIIVVDRQGCFRGILSVRQLLIQQSSLLANSIVQREMANERSRELEKINVVKSQFIANVTHELRSPVNAIIGLAELMKIACEKGHITQVLDRLALVTSSAVNLRAIITNILDLSKIEAGKMEIFREKTDIGQLIQDVAETGRVLLGSKPVSVHVSGDSGVHHIETDPVKLRQILTNLISNAVKFTDRGSITIDLGRNDKDVTIAISDTGIGIKEEDKVKIFQAFSQVENAHTKRYDGTGLGLTITRNLVSMLGGHISIASIYGKGSLFTVSLPVNTYKEEDDNDKRSEEDSHH